MIALLQFFVRAAEYDLTLFQHNKLGVDQAKLIVFGFEYDFAIFIDRRVTRRQQSNVFQPVRNKNRTDAFQIAYAYLNRRERTVAEVRGQLERKGISEEHAEEAVQMLIGQGMVSDERFAEMFVTDKRELELHLRSLGYSIGEAKKFISMKDALERSVLTA